MWKRQVYEKEAIVFRFFDLESGGLNTAGGFRAGNFTGMEDGKLVDLNYEDNPVPPADFNTNEFIEPAFLHLTRVKVPTPFISLRANLLSVMHRGLVSKAKACISFVDLGYVSFHQPFPLPRLFRGYKVSQRLKELGKVHENLYNAYGE